MAVRSHWEQSGGGGTYNALMILGLLGARTFQISKYSAGGTMHVMLRYPALQLIFIFLFHRLVTLGFNTMPVCLHC